MVRDMNEFSVRIKSINKLSAIDVTTIYSRLSHPDSGSDSSIQKELNKRYVDILPGPHPDMSIAVIHYNDEIVGWVGTRLWPEKFKGDKITAQTVECFVDPAWRRRGIARLGLQALISAGYVDRTKFVSVYAPEVVELARSCGCRTVLLCETTK